MHGLGKSNTRPGIEPNGPKNARSLLLRLDTGKEAGCGAECSVPGTSEEDRHKVKTRMYSRPCDDAEVPLRIGLLAPSWVPVSPRAYGGTESVIDQLARLLTAAGHHVILYTTGDSTAAVPTAHSLPTAAIDRIGAGDVELSHVMHGYETLAGCDVVHDHTLLGPAWALAVGHDCDKGVRQAALVARAAGHHLLIAAKMREPCEHAYFTDQVKPLLGDGVELVGEITNGDKLALPWGCRRPWCWPGYGFQIRSTSVDRAGG